MLVNMPTKTMPLVDCESAKGEKLTKLYEPNSSPDPNLTQEKKCLCEGLFYTAESFVVLEKPVLTIIGICGDCSRQLGDGSFKERLELAARLIRSANDGRSG